MNGCGSVTGKNADKFSCNHCSCARDEGMQEIGGTVPSSPRLVGGWLSTGRGQLTSGYSFNTKLVGRGVFVPVWTDW